MSKKLIVARTMHTSLTNCCRGILPAEEVAGNGICVNCWIEAGNERGWRLMAPDILAVAQTLTAQLAGHIGARGIPEDVNQTLARLLFERAQILLGHIDSVMCCYCAQDGSAVSLSTMPYGADFVTLWYCDDRQACAHRLAEAIRPLLAAMHLPT